MEILSPAKINLFLIVKRKRADGYHDLVTLLCRVGIFDTVILEFDQKDITVSCSSPKVPSGETNIAHKAASIFLTTLAKNGKQIDTGVKISINKRIPVGAGLGGGSSNAASVLMGLNRHYGSPFSKNSLIAMGLSIGTDVPFFIFEKPAFATGIGEKLIAFKGLKPYNVVLVYPGKSISTQVVYKNLNLGLTKCKQKLNYFLFEKKVFRSERYLCNDLETVTQLKYPEIISIKTKLLTLGAKGALMTGSGPAVFGLFSDFDSAGRAYHSLLKNKNWEVFLTDLIV